LSPFDNGFPIPAGGSIAFPQNGPSSGSIYRSSVSSFVLPNIGTYEVNFQVGTVNPGQLVLGLNALQLMQTVVGTGNEFTQIVGLAYITTTAVNSVLSVINDIINGIPFTIAPNNGGLDPVSAHLTIKQLA